MITSRQNPRIKEFMQLAKKSSDGRVLAEGVHLLREALACGVGLEAVLTVPRSATPEVEAAVAEAAQRGVEIVEMSEDCFKKFSQLKSSETVALIYRQQEVAVAELVRPGARLAVLDNIQDPGNAGAMVRIAEATGMDGCIFVGGASPANGKFIRASMGTVFRVACLQLERSELLELAASGRIKLYATALNPQARPFNRVEYTASEAALGICFGSEGGGVAPEILELSEQIFIPMAGRVESLNVAVAAGIVLYHVGLGG